MIVIMLNFLIAVITSTYERVNNYQKIISFKHKAELNKDCYILIRCFKELPEYKLIVFSTSKEATTVDDNVLEEAVVDLKRYVSKETREIKSNQKEINDNI